MRLSEMIDGEKVQWRKYNRGDWLPAEVVSTTSGAVVDTEGNVSYDRHPLHPRTGKPETNGAILIEYTDTDGVKAKAAVLPRSLRPRDPEQMAYYERKLKKYSDGVKYKAVAERVRNEMFGVLSPLGLGDVHVSRPYIYHREGYMPKIKEFRENSEVSLSLAQVKAILAERDALLVALLEVWPGGTAVDQYPRDPAARKTVRRLIRKLEALQKGSAGES